MWHGMSDPAWYLLKHEDASVFGPISFALLADWARAAQISPLDKVSTDGTNWMRAPMLPELRMDWLVQVNGEHCYGPTTLGAVQEFLERGEIALDTELINACDGSCHHVGDLPFFNSVTTDETRVGRTIPADGRPAPGLVSGGVNAPGVEERIQMLELELQAERRALAELRERYARLEARHSDRAAMPGSPPP